MTLSQQITEGYETVSTYATDRYTNFSNWLSSVDTMWQAEGFDADERSGAGQALAGSPALAALFSPNAQSAAVQALAATAVWTGIGRLKDLSNVYKAAGERLIAITQADPNSGFRAALSTTLTELVQPANNNPDPKIIGKATALAKASVGLGLIFAAAEIYNSSNPQSEVRAPLSDKRGAHNRAFTVANYGTAGQEKYLHAA